jgi:curved DNA-binding protein CbpA
MEIRQAYRRRAAQLHPDVNKDDPPAVAMRKFQDLHRAYETLMKVHSNLAGDSYEKDDEWRFSVWRNGDRLAIDRTDVAGVLRKRPAPPAETPNSSARRAGALLGHPSGRGSSTASRGEYLQDGEGGDARTPSSSVGRGLNKWVKRKEFVAWDGKTSISARNHTSNMDE